MAEKSKVKSKKKTKVKAPAGVKVKLDAKAILAVVVCVALSAATYFFFTSPMRRQAADLDQQVTVAQAQLAANNQRISDIENGRTASADQVLVQAQHLDKLLPADVDKVALVASIPTLADQYGVTVNQMDPIGAGAPGAATPSAAPTDPAAAPAAPTGALMSQTFQVAAQGSLDQVTGWIAALQSFPSTVSISNLALNMTSETDASASFQLNAYYVPTAAVEVVKGKS